MNELFVTENFLELELFYKIEKSKGGSAIPVAITEEEYNQIKASDQKDKAKLLKTSWRYPSWREGTNLLQQTTKFNHITNQDDINWTLFRDKRLKTLLVKWDAKNEKGEPIPVSDATIDSLHQGIAMALLALYDSATRPAEEEQKKTS